MSIIEAVCVCGGGCYAIYKGFFLKFIIPLLKGGHVSIIEGAGGGGELRYLQRILPRVYYPTLDRGTREYRGEGG